MLESETPKPSRDIVCCHDVSPPTFEVTDGDVDLLELVVTIRLGEGHLDTILINSLLEIGMPSSKGGSHIDLEVRWNPDFVAKSAE